MIACKQAHALADRVTAGESLSHSETEALEAHLTACPECATWAKGFEALARAPDEAHFPTTPTERQRLLARAVSEACSPDRVSGFWGRRAVWLAAAAAVVLAVVAGAWLTQAWVRNPPRTVQLVLAAGSDDGAAGHLGAGAVLAAGETWKSSERTLAMRLGPDARLWLHPHSELTLTRARTNDVRLSLNRGELFGAVDKGEASTRFRFDLPGGSAEITGTRFSLSAGTTSTVAVYRGEVRVESAATGVEATVGGGQQVAIGHDTPDVLPTDRLTHGQELDRRLTLLAARTTGHLELTTLPPGVQVVIDGVIMGTAPLSAALTPGSHRVALVQYGRRVIEEEIEVEANATVTRRFDLRSAGTVSVEPPSEPEPELLDEPDARRPHKKARPPLAVADALERARELRSQTRWRKAAAVYRQLLRDHPDDPHAQAALVSVANIELEHLNQPQAALRACERYVRNNPQGLLRIEAEMCRIQALARLGNAQGERRAIEAFLGRFPESMEAPGLRERLRALPESVE